MSIESAAIRIIGLALLCWLAAEVVIAVKQRRRRNRWLSAPRPDERGSIEQFKRMHRP